MSTSPTATAPDQTQRPPVVWPYRVALAIEVLAFHWRVLFVPGYLFPWDFRAVHLPLANLIADAYRRGQWPLWDPFTYCGMPISANIQAAAFYPPVMLASLGGAWLGSDALPRLLAISVAAQIIFAGFCVFAMLRRLQARPGAAWIAATVYQLGCFFAAQAEHMGAVQAAAWLPLIWWCVVELAERIRLRWLAALSIALAMTIFAGLPQVAVAAFASAAMLALLLAAFRISTWRLPALFPPAAIWALLLAAVQFIPTAEFTQNSVAKYRAEWLGTGGGMAPSALLTLVSPNYWSVFDLSKFHGPADPTFLYLYSSLLGLLLAVAALVWRPSRWVRVFAAVLLLSTFAMLGDKTPPGRALLTALPDWLRIGIHPEFFFAVFSLALAVLAGLGAERLLRSSRLQIAAGVVIACDLILVSSGRPMNTASRQAEPGFTRQSVDGSQELVARLRRITDRAVPSLRFDARPEVSFLWSSSAPILGIPTANGCDPMAPERTIEARRAFAPGPRWGTCYQVVDAASPAVSLMNTGALISIKSVDAPGMRLDAEVRGYKLYENQRVLPRFFFVSQVRAAANLEEAGRRVREKDFDPSGSAIVEGFAEATQPFAKEGASAVLDAYAAERIDLKTTSPGPAFLVATDSYYPGWQAWIDGSPVRLYAADAAFRGVVVPAGQHRVEMRFVPSTLYRSAMVSAAAFLFTVLVFFRRPAGAGKETRQTA